MSAPHAIDSGPQGAWWGRHAGSLAVLAFVLVLHTAVNAWWLSRDNLPRMGDDAQHAVFARELYDIATHPQWSLQGRIKALALASTGIYPPLFHFMAMVSGFVFGPSRAGFAAVNTGILGCLALAAYALAARVVRPRYALLAATLCTALPLVAGVSRLCVTDLLTALWVTLACLALMCTRGFQSRPSALFFGVLTGVGLLTRWMMPLYLAAPVCVALIMGWRAVHMERRAPEAERVPRRYWLVTLSLSAACALVIAAPWYAPRIPGMIAVYSEHFRPMDGPSPFHAGGVHAGGRVAAAGQGAAGGPAPMSAPLETPSAAPSRLRDFGPFEARTWISYALLLNNKALFLPISLLTLAGLGLALPRARRSPDLALILAAVAGSYLLLTIFWVVRAPAPRYLIPMLPALCILPAYALERIPGARVRTMAVAVTCAWLAFQYVQFSLAPLTPLTRLDIPLYREHPYVRDTDDRGIVVFSSHVNASGARIGPPYTGPNWVDRVFGAMARHEVLTWPAGHHQANLMFAGALKPALESVQHEHWPLLNPLTPDSPRVRALVNPYAPMAARETTAGAAELHWPWAEPAWLDAVTLTGAERAAGDVQYRAEDGAWLPLGSLDGRDGFAFLSFPRVRATALRLHAVQGGGGPLTLTAFQAHPQPRPFILIEHAERPRQWPAERMSVADYLVVVMPPGSDYYRAAPEGFELLERFEEAIHGYWDERRITLHARRHPHTIALDTTPGMRVRVIEGGPTQAGRWDLPWWRLGRFSALGLEGYHEGWEAAGPVVVQVQLDVPVALDALEAEAIAAGTAVKWAYRAPGGTVWVPLPAGAAPPGAVDGLRLTLAPSVPGGMVGLRQVTLRARAGAAP